MRRYDDQVRAHLISPHDVVVFAHFQSLPFGGQGIEQEATALLHRARKIVFVFVFGFVVVVIVVVFFVVV